MIPAEGEGGREMMAAFMQRVITRGARRELLLLVNGVNRS